MARMSKATGDEAIGTKATHLILEWAQAIEPDGFFYYSRRPFAPHYTYDKTVCGLVDLYEYGGRNDALPLLDKITDWAIANLDRIRKPDQGTEWYTLSGRTGKPLEFTAPQQPQGLFLPFYKVGQGVPYNMYFDLEG
jgi:hypothetical protein